MPRKIDAGLTAKNVAEVLKKHADIKSRLQTDESGLYPAVGGEFAQHETVNHSIKEYARGKDEALVTTNSVEGFFGVFKRGFNGIYQHCCEQHFQRYLDEHTFRYNNRVRLGVTDEQRAAKAIKGADGKAPHVSRRLFGLRRLIRWLALFALAGEARAFFGRT